MLISRIISLLEIRRAYIQGGGLQYRSKVSYHLSSRFSRDETLVSRDETLVSRYETLVSRDETLVSREPLKRIFWNKSHAVSLREND